MDRSLHANALRFAALGDETRLSLVMKLGRGSPLSIAELAEGTPMTRQAITKHLRILEVAGVVRAEKRGRESQFHMLPRSIEQSREALEKISRQWDDALVRLKAFVED